MKYLFAPIHFIVGGLIRLVDIATSPKPLKRPEQAQLQVNEECKNLTLYHYPACPFCVRVRRHMKRLNLPIRQIDPRKKPEWMDKLVNEGGKAQVPCLQIVELNGQITWMYESADINTWLDKEFSQS